MIRSLRISTVLLAASLAAGACQSGGAATTPTAIPTAMPTAIPTAMPTLAPHGVFGSTRSVSSDRWGHTATLLASGKVLITGGRVGSLPAASAELYDPDTESFSSTGSMSSARSEHTATVLANGKVLITGGFATNDSSSYLASAELYDPATGSFRSTGSMSSPRWAHTATLLVNGKVLIAGGTTYSTMGSFLASADLYDPATGIFSSTGSMSGTRVMHAATVLTSGKVLITGGFGGPSDQALAPAELYDPGTGSFNPAGSMTGGRARHTATLLANREVLIVGGGGYQVWPELYTP